MAPVLAAAAVTILFASACGDDKEGQGGGQGDGQGDGATVVGALAIDEVHIAPDAVIPSLSRVSWSTTAASVGSVCFRELGGDLLCTPVEADAAEQHQAVLVGLAEGIDAELQITSDSGDEQVSSAWEAFTTGTLDAGIPRPTLSTGSADDSVDGLLLMPVAGANGSWVTVVDPGGRLLWAWGGVELDTLRARLTHDGQGIVALDGVTDGNLELVRVDFDGTERWRLDVGRGHHDFDLVDDETFVMLAGDSRDIEGPEGSMRVVGDALAQTDLDGGWDVLWSAWDHFEPDPETLQRIDPGDESFDWSHGNYVRYDAESDAVAVVLRNIDAVVEVDRGSGDERWVLAPEDGDFDWLGSTDLLSYPHSAWSTDQDLLVFNQHDHDGGDCAEATLLELDEDAGMARRTWSYSSDECFAVGYLGNAQPLPSGRALVVFAQAGVIDQVDLASGQLAWRLTTPPEATLLYVEHFDAFGTNQP